MTRSRTPPASRTAIIALAMVVIVASLIASQSRTTLERGNRLYRTGNARAAADVYAVRIDTTAFGSLASYNLGTALIQLGAEQAERYLIGAIEGTDSAAVQRGHYNLGYRLLSDVDANGDPFAAVPLLTGAIDHNRAALRLDPSDQDARWNLALALQTYSEVAQVFEEGPVEDGGGGELETSEQETEAELSESAEGEAADEPEDVPPSESRSDPNVATMGAREALAKGDPGPLTEEMAMTLLEGLTDDTELLVRGLLWSQRPDIEWWEDEPFPGGSW